MGGDAMKNQEPHQTDAGENPSGYGSEFFMEMAAMRAEIGRLRMRCAALASQVPSHDDKQQMLDALQAAIGHIADEQAFWRHCVTTGVMRDPEGELDAVDRLLERLCAVRDAHTAPKKPRSPCSYPMCACAQGLCERAFPAADAAAAGHTP